MSRLERVLIYLVGSKHLKLTYTKTAAPAVSHWAPRVTVEGSSDSSFALAHSTTGYVFELANAAVTWLSKKQETIAISPQHAEVTAGSVGACEGV